MHRGFSGMLSLTMQAAAPLRACCGNLSALESTTDLLADLEQALNAAVQQPHRREISHVG